MQKKLLLLACILLLAGCAGQKLTKDSTTPAVTEREPEAVVAKQDTKTPDKTPLVKADAEFNLPQSVVDSLEKKGETLRSEKTVPTYAGSPKVYLATYKLDGYSDKTGYTRTTARVYSYNTKTQALQEIYWERFGLKSSIDIYGVQGRKILVTNYGVDWSPSPLGGDDAEIQLFYIDLDDVSKGLQEYN